MEIAIKIIINEGVKKRDAYEIVYFFGTEKINELKTEYEQTVNKLYKTTELSLPKL